jgi:hypothetical protein
MEMMMVLGHCISHSSIEHTIIVQNSMAFKEGHKKVGGRKQGTPNRLTKDFRKLLKSILYKEIEKIPEYLETLDLKERLDAIIKLLNYIVPKVKPVEPSRREPIEWDLF